MPDLFSKKKEEVDIEIAYDRVSRDTPWKFSFNLIYTENVFFFENMISNLFLLFFSFLSFVNLIDNGISYFLR